MAKVYANTMAARAGVVRVVDDGRIVSEYQAVMPAIRKVDYSDNKDYLVLPNDTWQSISLRFLGDATLWWVIAEFNRVIDPFEELQAGKRIVIPSPARVRLTALSRL